MAFQLSNKQTLYLTSEIFPKGKQYKAEIQKVEKDQITVELNCLPIEIPSGTPMTCYLWDDKMIYSFDTVTLTNKSYLVTLFQIRKPDHIRRKFKRNFQRIAVKIKATLMDNEGHSKETCFITDLSAGGAKTIARAGKQVGSTMMISFNLSPLNHFDKVGITIVRERKIDDKLSEYGFEFTAISKIRQEKLNDYVIEAIINNEANACE
jgi:c-di-GMP-binding flagellar brake protein YcgR